MYILHTYYVSFHLKVILLLAWLVAYVWVISKNYSSSGSSIGNYPGNFRVFCYSPYTHVIASGCGMCHTYILSASKMGRMSIETCRHIIHLHWLMWWEVERHPCKSTCCTRGYACIQNKPVPINSRFKTFGKITDLPKTIDIGIKHLQVCNWWLF